MNISFTQTRFQNITNKFLNSLIIFACFSISMPTAWMSIASGLVLIFWIISGNFLGKLDRILMNPIALAACTLLLIYFFAMLYSSASMDMRFLFFLKYLKLLLIPIVISSIDSEKTKQKALQAFLFGIFILLGISYLKWLHILPIDIGIHDIASPGQGFTAFKNRIAHNILLSFAMYLMLVKSLSNKSKMKWVWLALAGLTFFNIMYLVTGRTGQIIALSLIIFFMFKRLGLKALLFFAGLGMILFVFKAYIPNPLMPERLRDTKDEVVNFSEKNPTSAGLRFEMYKNTLKLIQKSPLLGYGTGALKQEYAKFSETHDTVLKDIPNPHNQYLLTFFELGLIGFLFLLNVYYQIWRHSNDKFFKKNHNNEVIQALLITFMIGSLFNSLLLDATEGKFFCVLVGLLFSLYKHKERILQPKAK